MMSTTEIILAMAIPVTSGLVLIYNEYQKRKLQRELTRLNTFLNEKLIVRKKQFEKEFEIYETLWPFIIEFRTIVDSMNFHKKSQDDRKKQTEDFLAKYKGLNKKIQQFEPFINSEIVRYTQKLSETGFLHSLNIDAAPSVSYDKDALSNIIANYERDKEKIQSYVKKISDTIKERLQIEDGKQNSAKS